jgi:hypothetical protein
VHPLTDPLQARSLGDPDRSHRHLHELFGHPVLPELFGAGAAAGDLFV